EGRPLRARLADALVGSVAASLACGTRSVGVVLLPAVVLADLARGRGRPGLATLTVVPVVLAGAGAQRALLALEGSYLDQLTWAPGLFAHNFVSLGKALGLFFDNGHSRAARLALFGGLLALAAAGYLSKLRRGPGVAEGFVAFYTAAITVWPSAEWG